MWRIFELEVRKKLMSSVVKFQKFKQWEGESDRLVDQKIDLFNWKNILTFQPNNFFYLSAPSM